MADVPPIIEKKKLIELLSQKDWIAAWGSTWGEKK
jgi:hypothetical protein